MGNVEHFDHNVPGPKNVFVNTVYVQKEEKKRITKPLRNLTLGDTSLHLFVLVYHVDYKILLAFNVLLPYTYTYTMVCTSH